MASLVFDPEYATDGSIGMTLTVDEGPMKIAGAEFRGEGRIAGTIPFVYTGRLPDALGEFGVPQAEGWTVELVSADHDAGTARFVARPA